MTRNPGPASSSSNAECLGLIGTAHQPEGLPPAIGDQLHRLQNALFNLARASRSAAAFDQKLESTVAGRLGELARWVEQRAATGAGDAALVKHVADDPPPPAVLSYDAARTELSRPERPRIGFHREHPLTILPMIADAQAAASQDAMAAAKNKGLVRYVQQIIDRMQAQATGRGVALQMDVSSDVIGEVPPAHVVAALEDVLALAIMRSPQESIVWVTVAQCEQQFEVEIADGCEQQAMGCDEDPAAEFDPGERLLVSARTSLLAAGGELNVMACPQGGRAFCLTWPVQQRGRRAA